jgi:hypothetical protein
MAKVIEVGKKMAAQSHMNQRRGPGQKNLGPSASKQANPTGMVRNMSPNLKGPDKGAGGR